MRSRNSLMAILSLMLSLSISLAVLSSGCGEPTIVPDEYTYLTLPISALLGSVSDAIRLSQDADAYAFIDDLGWSMIPQARVVIGRAYSGSGSPETLMENVRETLDRVGDLALAILGEWSIGLHVYDSLFGMSPPEGFVEISQIDPGAELEARFIALGTAGGDVLDQALELVKHTLNSVEPSGQGSVWEANYVPGVGAYVSLRFDSYDAPTELDECSEWVEFIQDALRRVDDILFAALKANETLTVCTGSLGFGMGTLYFSITGETMGASEGWDIDSVGGY